MTSRGGSDPNNSMASMPSAEWARRLGASPSKRMTASWSGSNTDPTEYKVAARCFAPNGGLPSGRSHRELDIQIPIQGVVGDVRMAARRVLAARDISPTGQARGLKAHERRRATALDRSHHLQLVEAHVPAVGLTPSRTVIAENVRDLQSWSSHGRRRYSAGGFSVSCLARLRRGPLRPSSGLSILEIIPVATRV